MASLWSYLKRGREPSQKFDTVGGATSYAYELTKRYPNFSLTRRGADTGTCGSTSPGGCAPTWAAPATAS